MRLSLIEAFMKLVPPTLLETVKFNNRINLLTIEQLY